MAQIDGVMMNTVYDIRLEEFGRPVQTPCWTRIAWGKALEIIAHVVQVYIISARNCEWKNSRPSSTRDDFYKFEISRV